MNGQQIPNRKSQQMNHRICSPTRVASRAAAVVLIIAASALGQTPAGSPKQKPGSKAAQSAKPAAVQPAAQPSDAVAAKGFSRIAVTPEVKQQFEGEQNRYAVIVA